MKKIAVFLLLLSIILLASCIKRKLEETLNVQISYYKDIIVGKKGTIIFYTDFFARTFQDTSKSTYFEAEITNNNLQSYVIKCGLWSEYDLKVFCNIDENIPKGEWIINLDGISFKYKDYIINLKYFSSIKFTKTDDFNIVDLYSDKQTINLDDGKQSYDLKFKIVSYNNEKIIINKNTVLDCKPKSDELICPITKKKLLSIIGPEDLSLRVYCLDNNYGFSKLPLIPTIDVEYTNFKKKE